MINQNLLAILKCINCEDGNIDISGKRDELICTSCKQSYFVHNQIPLLLQNNKEYNLVESEIHKKQGTKFNYIDHYQKDAINFDYFEERDRGTEHGERRVREYILSQVPHKSKKILDVGCGKAWVAKMFCPKNIEVVSMDIALTNVVKALEKYPFDNHSGVVADVFSLPFKENSFDCIIASEIIEHVINPDIFVKNLMHILKPGGELIVTTPYKEKLQYSLCIHCNKATPRHAHIHSFDENILTNLYNDDKVKSVEYKTFGNKALIHLRTHIFLKFLNFKIWNAIDKIANWIYKAPSTILVKWKKIIN